MLGWNRDSAENGSGVGVTSFARVSTVDCGVPAVVTNDVVVIAVVIDAIALDV